MNNWYGMISNFGVTVGYTIYADQKSLNFTFSKKRSLESNFDSFQQPQSSPIQKNRENL